MAYLTAAVASAVFVPVAGAATIPVSTTADVVADDGACAMREALTAANADAPSGVQAGECAGGDGADTVVVPAGQYVISQAKGALVITGSVTIDGAGSVTTSIAPDAGPTRVVLVPVATAPAVTIEGITLSGGSLAGGSDGAPGEHGGGIANSGPVPSSS